MRSRARELASTGAGAVVLVGVVSWVGWEPFVRGVSSLAPLDLAAVLALTLVATVACGWRWSLVARGLGVEVGVTAAAGACYQAQLLNLSLPGGVLGDVRRGWRHGRATGRTSRALRSVLWERSAGQAVQVVVLVVVLAALPGPFRPVLVVLVAAVALAVAGLVLLHGRPAAGAVLGTVADDLRRGVLARSVWPGAALGSVLALGAHLAAFVVAARAAGVTAPTVSLLPVGLLVLTAAALPAGVAGWGPREGAAAGAFAAAGLGAEAGAATAAAYGVLVLAAHLPAAALVLRGTQRRRATPGLGDVVAEVRTG